MAAAPTQAAPPPAADTAPASPGEALIVFANTPGAHCGACETVKLSVSPWGNVLIERSWWDGAHRNWHYKHIKTHATPERAAAFAARLDPFRPTEGQAANAPACSAATEDDGLTILWIDGDRQDRLDFPFLCPARRTASMAETLRHAPDLLGLGGLDFAWNDGR